MLSKNKNFKIRNEIGGNLLRIALISDKKREIIIKYKKIGREAAVTKVRERIFKEIGEIPDDSWF